MPGNSTDIYEQAVVKTVAGFFRGNPTLSPQQPSPAGNPAARPSAEAEMLFNHELH